ncbi:MAG: SDR family oxidoreductase [Flavobacteriales bacterium]
MRIVVLGATGHIGSMVMSQLQQLFPQDEIIGCARSAKGKNFLSFNIYQEHWSALGKVDVLINSVGIIEEKDENSFEKVHVQLVKDILKRRESLGNPRIVHVSVLGADVRSKAEYSRTKGVADELLQQEKNVAIVRPSFVLTPGTAIVQKVNMLVRISKWMLGLLLMPAHFLASKSQPVMGEDVAELIARLSKNPFTGVVYATGPKQMHLSDMIGFSRSKVKIVPLPKWLTHWLFMLITSFKNPLMNRDQYYLLALDNVHDHSGMEKILGRKASATEEFWKNEIK